jgi:acetylornithine deacetylase/succinyl-diaminopimelate desuccinylase-like protein
MDSVIRYINQNKDRYIEELKELLRIPSVSAKSTHRNDCLQAAEYLQKQFQGMGLEVSLLPTKGNPVVLARYQKHADKPTVLIYGHYDVQPEEPVELWLSPPFEPTIRDGNIHARGATDDKGQVFTHIKAIEAHLKTNGELPVNIIFLIEGEEEIHSLNLDAFLHEHKHSLKADVALISDSSQYGRGKPAITYGLRGICGEEIRVEGANQDLHSGSFGGAVPNPIQVLCQIIARMKDEKGKILIPGFYDDVLPLEEWERKNFASLDWDDEQFKKDLGLEEIFGEEGYTTIERKWARPTFEVNGIFGGYSGEGSKTVLPAWAGAKFTMRLVPNPNPDTIDDLFKKYVRKITPSYVRLQFLPAGGAGPVLVPRNAQYMKEAEEALERGFSARPCYIREGGSIPIVLTLKELLGIDTILMGFGLNDDNPHAPNEKFSLEDFEKGILTSAWFLHLCSQK